MGGGPDGARLPEGRSERRISSTATIPVVSVDTSERFRHTLNWADASAPNIKRKPKGVTVSECQYLTTDTRSPHVVEYEASEAGQLVHYIYSWLLLVAGGAKSSFGEAVSATITG